MGQKKVGQFPAYQMVGSESWTVEKQVKNDWGLGLDSWRTRSEWLGARPGRLEKKSKTVEKLGQGPAGWLFEWCPPKKID